MNFFPQQGQYKEEEEMHMHPFDQIPPSLEQGFIPLERLCSHITLPYDEPYAHLRALLLHAMESLAEKLSCQAFLASDSQEERRQLALICRVEARQGVTLSALRRADKTQGSIGLYLAMLGLELSAVLAQRLPEGALRQALHFALPEFLDEVYRLSNLMMLEKNIPAQKILGGYVEIMPGRPLIACHRHPYDDVKARLAPQHIWEKMASLMMIAVTEEQQRFFQEAAFRAESMLEQEIFAEMTLIAQGHQTLFLSLLPSETPLARLMLCQYTEGYIYDSCAGEEKNPALRQLYLQERDHEFSHIQKIAAQWAREKGADVSMPEFPARLQMGPNKGYVRDVLQNAGVTGMREGYAAVGSLPLGADFFRYQQKICPHPENVPSHQVISRIIEKTGEDYRYEIASHPMEAMRNRNKDNIQVGR